MNGVVLISKAYWRCPKCGCSNPIEISVTKLAQRRGSVRKCIKPRCGKTVAVSVKTATKVTHDVAISELAWEGA